MNGAGLLYHGSVLQGSIYTELMQRSVEYLCDVCKSIRQSDLIRLVDVRICYRADDSLTKVEQMSLSEKSQTATQKHDRTTPH